MDKSQDELRQFSVMINLPVYNCEGKQVDQIPIDEAVFGGTVNTSLLKQSIVMYHANSRQGSAATKSRGMVAGSTKKLYRQKGTGNARMGNIRTVVRRGGGVAFAKQARDFSQKMPKKQRRMARDSAILNKLQNNDAVVVDSLDFEVPKTATFASILKNLNIDRGCLVAMEEHDVNVRKSLRNIPRVDSLTVDQLNAGDICRRRKLLFTRAALDSLLKSHAGANSSATADKPKAAEAN